MMAFFPWVQATHLPRAKQTRQHHTRPASLWAPAAPTDLAGDDQRAHTALGLIIIWDCFGDEEKDEQFRQEALDPLTERVHWCCAPEIGRTHVPKLLLVGVLEFSPQALLGGSGQGRIGAAL